MAYTARQTRRRRFNLKFLLWVVGGLTACAALVFGAKEVIFSHDTRWYVQAGDQAFKRQNWVEADKDYKTALSKSNSREMARVAYQDGLTLQKMAQDNVQVWRLDRPMFAKALTMDPTFLPAAEALLDAGISDANISPSPSVYAQLLDTCKHILEIKPNHPRAQAYLHIAPLASWLTGVNTSPEEIDKNTAALVQLMEEAPDDADIPYTVARVYLARATQERQQGSEEHARDLTKAALDVFEQAVKRSPENAAMHFRYYLILAACAPSPRDERYKDFVSQMNQELDLACKYTTSSEPLVDDIFINAVQYQMQHRNMPRAEEVSRAMLHQDPADQLARLTVAQTLQYTNDPKKIDEAIELLKQPIGDLKHYRSLLSPVELRHKIEVTTVVALDELLLAKYRITPDVKDKQDLMRQIEDNYLRIADRSQLDYTVLRLRGKIDMMGGTSESAISAIQEFERAKRLFEQTNANKADVDLLELLAKSYMASHQNGTAKRYLRDIIKLQQQMGQDAYQDRVLLTQLLLDEGLPDEQSTKEALDQIRVLTQAYPNAADVRRLALVYYTIYSRRGGQANANVQTILVNLPEGTVSEKWSKAQLAVQMHSFPVAIALLEDLRKEKELKDPTRIQVVDELAVAYTANQHPEQALKMLDEEIKTADPDSPENGEFVLLKSQLNKEPADKIEALTMASMEKIKDPCQRELKIFEHLAAIGKPESEALPHLDAAEKADPENMAVMNHRFELALEHQKWDDAEALADKLGAKNFDEADGQILHYRVALAKGDLPTALGIAQNLTKNLPEFSRSWQCLGQVLEAQHEYSQAMSDYLLALDKQTDNVDAYRGIVECCYAMNKPEEAHQYLERGLLLNPSNAYLREQLIQFFLKFDDPAKALDARVAERDANPQDMAAWIRLADAYTLAAQYRARQGQQDATGQALQLAAQTISQAMAKWPDEMTLYAYMSNLRMLTNDMAGGEKVLLDLQQRPTMKMRYEPREMLADFYARYGQVDKAKASYEEARKLSGNLPTLQIKQAMFLARVGDLDGALKVLDPNSDDQRVQMQIVETLINSNKMPEAKRVIDAQLAKIQHGGSSTAPASTPIAREQVESFYHGLLGYFYITQKQWDEARDQLERALELDKNNARALYFRGRVELMHDPVDPQKAYNDFKAARDLDPTNINYHQALAELLRMGQHMDDAVRELETAVRIAPDKKQLRLELLEYYAQCNPQRWVDANHQIEEAIKAVPQWGRDPEFAHAAAVVSRGLGRTDDAIRLYVQSIQMSPQKQWVGEFLELLDQAQKWLDLEANCNQLLSSPDWQKSPWIYRMRAKALSKLDRPEEAMKDYDYAFQLAGDAKPADLATMDIIIQEMARSFGWDAAIARIQARIKQGDPHWIIMGAYMYSQHDKVLAAEQLIEGLLSHADQLTPTDLEIAQEVAGVIYMNAQEYGKARNIYESLLARNPNHPVALNNMADILCEHSKKTDNPADAKANLDKAKDFALRAMKVFQDQNQEPTPAVLDTYGWILVYEEDLQDAVRSFEQALVKKPDFLEARFHLGFALAKQKKFGDALNQLNMAQSIISTRQKLQQPVDPVIVQRVPSTIKMVQEAQQKDMQTQGSDNP